MALTMFWMLYDYIVTACVQKRPFLSFQTKVCHCHTMPFDSVPSPK